MRMNNTIKMQIIKNDYRSVQEFSNKNNLSYYMVRKLANNEATNIDIELLIRLCEIFKCDVGDLFYIEQAG